MEAFLFYIDDWESSLRLKMMDAYEERAYLRMLMYAFKQPDCGLPDDDIQLAIISMLGKQWSRPTKERQFRIAGRTSGQKVRACFEARGGRLYNERLLREWSYQRTVNEKRRSAGLLGVEAKRRKQTVDQVQDQVDIQSDKQMDVHMDNKLGLEFTVSSFSGSGTPENGSSVEEDMAGFDEYLKVCEVAGLIGSETDKLKAKLEWRRLDFEQRNQAVQGIRDRIDAGEFTDAAYRPLPQNYLYNRVWQRAVRKSTPKTTAKLSEADRIFTERKKGKS